MREEKRKRESEKRTHVSKRIRASFESMLGNVRNEINANTDQVQPVDQIQESEHSRKISNQYSKLVETARSITTNNREINPTARPRGEEKKTLGDIKNRDDYIKISDEAVSGIDFLIRRSSQIDSKNLYARETNYDVEVRTSSELANITLAGLLMSIWDIFDRLFSECLKEDGFDEVCFHCTHRELEGSLSSSIYELKEENRDTIIQEIMSRLTGWNQSSSPGAAGKHLGISVTLLKRNLPGNGIILAIGDDNLRRKAFSKSNFNGSIFYVDCEENCFFVSIYFGLVYNSYVELFKKAKTRIEKKRLHLGLYEKLGKKGQEVQEEAKSFFAKKYKLDIENFESGSTVFLKSLCQKALCQVSVFSDEDNYRRVLMIPEKYDPLLQHVNILLTQYLRKTEVRKTVRNEKEFSGYHYHGIKITCRGFTGQNITFCVYCGTYHSYSNVNHSCKKSDLLCEMCLRPVVEANFFSKISSLEQTNFCFQAAENVLRNCEIVCRICKKKAKSTLCYTIHERQKCRERVRCEICNRVIKLVGKYAVQIRGKIIKRHDSCEEVFCNLCNDYVDGYEDLKNPNHVCYVPTLTRAKAWPSQMVCFDFETFPNDENGTMRANLVHMIYQEHANMPQSNFKGIFFSDVPMENVYLNNQAVAPGIEYDPGLGDELKNYYPFEVLKKELEGHVETAADKKKKNVTFENRPYDNHPCDPDICHLLRNPEVADLNLFGAVKDHVDIFDLQVGESVNSEDDSEEPALLQENVEKRKKFDWRAELVRLSEADKTIVDKMRKARNDVTEEEARLEDDLFVQSVSLKKTKKKTCQFILQEACEANDDMSDESGIVSEDENFSLNISQELQQNTLYFKNCAYEPTESTGDVPGTESRNIEETIDFEVREMAKEENLKKIIESCKNYFPHWKQEDNVDMPDKNFKRFCQHENLQDLKKRYTWFKKSEAEKKSNALKQFALYILQPRFRNAVFLGMYSSGFDNHFVFTQLVEMGVRVNPVFKGNKLITFSIPALNIRFLDFFCYVPSSLKNLEKSFDLKTGSKGYFPHLLNHPKNYGLILPHLPPKFFYEPEMMKKEDLLEFDSWYEKNYFKTFNFGQELLTYCELDVKILMAACLTFVKETLVQQSEFFEKVRQLKPNGREITFLLPEGKTEKIEPNLVHVFSSGLCTLSSYVNNLFRSFYLVEKSLPIISHDVEEGYSTKSSRVELEVLTYIRDVEKVQDLQFGDRYRGQRRFTVVCPESGKTRTFYVDGYSPKSKTVFEVLGCVFHGCYDCFTASDKLKNGLDNYEGVRITEKRISLLKLHPEIVAVRVVKECEWKKQKQNEAAVANFCKEKKMDCLGSRRMSLKETFRGGLVEPLCVAYDAKKVSEMLKEKFNETLTDPYGKMIDINSMYPAQLMPSFSYSSRDLDYVMCPVNGHQILRGSSECLERCNSACIVECRRRDKHSCEENVTCYKTCDRHHPPSEWSKLPAFALVKILPPRNQRFPILRMRLSKKEGSKNFSTLCRTCALENTAFQGLIKCSHNDQERCLFGEFTTAELNFAILNQGYRLLDVFEVQFYPEYSLTMFQNLLKSFYMMKVASKGYPDSCTDVNGRQGYLEELRQTCSFGEELQPSYIQNNPARITVSKLSANALVGKLGQSQNRANKKVVMEHSQVVEIRSSKYYELTAVKLINERCALVSYKPLEDRIKPYKYGCVAIPSQVTAYSRIYLTRLSMKLEDQGHVVAYCDTDSILAFPGCEKAPKLEELCQISDRLGCLKVEKDGVEKFFSTAAKTYCLETVDGKVAIKAKGFSLLEKLLKDNNKECLLEKNILKLFSGLDSSSEKADTSTLVFQKQIKVNPFHMVPALIPKEKSYKVLNVIGPRRQVDIDNWLQFQFVRVSQKSLEKTQIDSLSCVKPLANLEPDYLFACKNKKDTLFLANNCNESILNPEAFRVILMPQIRGLLPALPFGFSLQEIKNVLPFYKLID